MKSGVLLSVIALTSLVVACDDEGATAPAKCRSLAKQVCESIIDCGLAEESDLAVCTADVAENMGCHDAVGIERDYNTCMDDVVRQDQCFDWPEMPTSCSGVILVDE